MLELNRPQKGDGLYGRAGNWCNAHARLRRLIITYHSGLRISLAGLDPAEMFLGVQGSFALKLVPHNPLCPCGSVLRQ